MLAIFFEKYIFVQQLLCNIDGQYLPSTNIMFKNIIFIKMKKKITYTLYTYLLYIYKLWMRERWK